MLLTVDTFFHRYINHPLEAPTEKDRRVALVTSIFLGIFTLGIVHLCCYLAFADKKVKHVTIPTNQGDQNNQNVQMRRIYSASRRPHSFMGPSVGRDKVNKKSKVERLEKKARKISKAHSTRELDDVQRLMRKADEGDVESQYKLARKYLSGKGVKASSKEAYHWFHEAAMKGHVKARYRVGLLYLEGKGCQKTTSKAKHWLGKAAEKGHEKAKEKLAEINASSK